MLRCALALTFALVIAAPSWAQSQPAPGRDKTFSTFRRTSAVRSSSSGCASFHSRSTSAASIVTPGGTESHSTRVLLIGR